MHYYCTPRCAHTVVDEPNIRKHNEIGKCIIFHTPGHSNVSCQNLKYTNHHQTNISHRPEIFFFLSWHVVYLPLLGNFMMGISFTWAHNTYTYTYPCVSNGGTNHFAWKRETWAKPNSSLTLRMCECVCVHSSRQIEIIRQYSQGGHTKRNTILNIKKKIKINKKNKNKMSLRFVHLCGLINDAKLRYIFSVAPLRCKNKMECVNCK